MSSKRELRFLPALEMRVATSESGQRTLSGYAAVFNSPSLDLGGFTETLAPGCFSKSLIDNPDVLMLRDHDTSILLGRTKSGTLTLAEDNVGLRFECKLPRTTQATDLIASIERGDLDGCSFGFICRNDSWISTPDGEVRRTILEAELFEVSAVSMPAYPASTVNVRTAPKEIRDRLKAEQRDSGCECDCEQCLLGDCADCSDPDCSFDNCPCEQTRTAPVSQSIPDSDRYKLEIRLALAQRGHYQK